MNEDLIYRPVQEVREWLDNNRRVATLVLVGIGVLYLTGNIPSNPLPSWWPVAAIAVGVAAIGGRWASKHILDLIPDPEGILIVEFDASDTGGGAIYEISPEAFEQMRVVGDLFQWDRSSRRVYEVRQYDRINNVAVGNWRETKPGSALAAECTVEDVIASIRELREELEPDAAESRALRRHIRSIIRTLDDERARAIHDMVDSETSLNMGLEKSIDGVIDDELPDDLHPEKTIVGEDVEDGPDENGHAPDDETEPEDVEDFDLEDLKGELYS